MDWWKEALGIAASLFILISFIFKGELKIRTINIVGCVFFVIYGIMIKSFSVYFMNGTLIFVHIFYILRLKKKANNEEN